MNKPICPQKSPYVLAGEKKKYAWCSCGKSAQQPFCDGSHKGTEFSPIIVDNLKWNGEAKKNGFEMGDYISEFKIENSARPSKNIVYPIALILLVICGYFNIRRKE